MHVLRRSLTCLLLAHARYAEASNFRPECTIPPPGTTYVSGPSTRGTTAILINCLSIILLCTWNIQHLNVPAARPQPKSTFQGICWAILDSRTKIKWMLFTILIPEYIAGKAFGEWLAARSGVRRHKQTVEMSNNAEKSGQWEKIHVYMANMGYFVVDFGDVLDDRQGLAHFQKLVKRVEDYVDFLSSSMELNLSRLRHRTWALNNAQLNYACIQGLIDMPHVPCRHLAMLDRGDKLVKAFALLQIIYLVLQLIARRAAGLPSTQLEIAALAFATSSMVTYILYWSRPQGVESVHVIKAKRMPHFDNFWVIVTAGAQYLGTYGRTEGRIDTELDLAPLPNDSQNSISDGTTHSGKIWKIFNGNEEVVPLTFGAVFSGSLFGGLHCLAWDFQFPTGEEALGWKVSSLLTTTIPILAIAPFIWWQQLNPRPGTGFTSYHQSEAWKKRSGFLRIILVGRAIKYLVRLVLITLLATYVLARLFLIVEIFRSLFFLPPEAFIDTWSGSFPHFTK